MLEIKVFIYVAGIVYCLPLKYDKKKYQVKDDWRNALIKISVDTSHNFSSF